MSNLLTGATPVVATVSLSGGGFIAKAKSRDDVEILQVTLANRDELPAQIRERITGM